MTTPPNDDIAGAVAQWGRARFAGPRHLDALVIGVEHRDEKLERVATRIVKRTLREARVATSARSSTAPRVALASVDPFAYTPESLRAATEHVSHCAHCHASGRMSCGACNGTGNGRCPACRGLGKVQSTKSNRMIQCKACKTTGSAPCRTCAGAGSVYCNACMGSGHELAWLELRETEHTEVSVPLDSPLVVTHRALREARPIARGELDDIVVLDERSADGPLDLQQLAVPDQPAVRAQLARIDPRLERVRHQQYLKLSSIRRDVTYEMCGARATLSLCGNRLTPATTPAATRPIRYRAWLWLILVLGVFATGVACTASMLGQHPYYAVAYGRGYALTALASFCAIPALGAALRAWRGGLRFHRLRWPTAMWAALAASALAFVPISAQLAQPALDDVARAVAEHRVADARAILAAYQERAPASAEAANVQDDVMLAEAQTASGAPRLALLDRVAERHGAASERARAAAMASRLDDARQYLAADPAKTLAALDRDFARDPAQPVAALRALAHDALATRCTTAACTLSHRRQAVAAQTTPARTAALGAARAAALAALDPKRVDAKDLLPRLQQLRALRDEADAARTADASDAELQARAKTAFDVADAQRLAVGVLGRPIVVANELLGPTHTASTDIAKIALDGTEVFLVVDRAGIATAAYVTGDAKHARAIALSNAATNRLLTQLVGRATAVPATARDTARWYAGSYPTLARWDGTSLVELRVGNATP